MEEIRLKEKIKQTFRKSLNKTERLPKALEVINRIFISLIVILGLSILLNLINSNTALLTITLVPVGLIMFALVMW